MPRPSRRELLARAAVASGRPASARNALTKLRRTTDDDRLSFWAGLELAAVEEGFGDGDRLVEKAARVGPHVEDDSFEAVRLLLKLPHARLHRVLPRVHHAAGGFNCQPLGPLPVLLHQEHHHR